MILLTTDDLIEPELFENYYQDLNNCTENGLIDLTKSVLRSCEIVYERVEAFFSRRLKNRFEMGDSTEIGFQMIGTNSTDVLRAIDGIRRNRHKFICLNDNIDHNDLESKNVVKVLHDFYESFFPLPSEFELPEGKENKYLHLSEVVELYHF